VDDLYGPFADQYAVAVTRRRLLGAFLLFAATIAAIGEQQEPGRERNTHEPEIACGPLPNPWGPEFSSEFGAGPGLRCDTSSLPGAPKIRFQPSGTSIDLPGA
jgi:hypothetical protein